MDPVKIGSLSVSLLGVGGNYCLYGSNYLVVLIVNQTHVGRLFYLTVVNVFSNSVFNFAACYLNFIFKTKIFNA